MLDSGRLGYDFGSFWRYAFIDGGSPHGGVIICICWHPAGIVALWKKNLDPFAFRKDQPHSLISVWGVYTVASCPTKKLTGGGGLGEGPSPQMFLLLSFIASAFASVSLCDTTHNYPFQVTSISLNPPDVATPGHIVTMSVNYTTPYLIVNGTSKTTVRYYGIPLPPYIESICDIVSCPIKAGENSLTYKFQYPYGFVGRTSTTVIWYDHYATTFMCLRISLRTA